MCPEHILLMVQLPLTTITWHGTWCWVVWRCDQASCKRIGELKMQAWVNTACDDYIFKLRCEWAEQGCWHAKACRSLARTSQISLEYAVVKTYLVVSRGLDDISAYQWGPTAADWTRVRGISDQGKDQLTSRGWPAAGHLSGRLHSIRKHINYPVRPGMYQSPPGHPNHCPLSPSYHRPRNEMTKSFFHAADIWQHIIGSLYDNYSVLWKSTWTPHYFQTGDTALDRCAWIYVGGGTHIAVNFSFQVCY